MTKTQISKIVARHFNVLPAEVKVLRFKAYKTAFTAHVYVHNFYTVWCEKEADGNWFTQIV